MGQISVTLGLAFNIFAAPAIAQDVQTPSGMQAALYDVVMEPEVARFRFLVPQITDRTFGDTLDDIQYLCDVVAIPGLQGAGADMAEVVISLSAAEVPFGEISPDVTQFFQPFAIVDDTCVWEDF